MCFLTREHELPRAGHVVPPPDILLHLHAVLPCLVVGLVGVPVVVHPGVPVDPGEGGVRGEIICSNPEVDVTLQVVESSLHSIGPHTSKVSTQVKTAVPSSIPGQVSSLHTVAVTLHIGPASLAYWGCSDNRLALASSIFAKLKPQLKVFKESLQGSI